VDILKPNCTKMFVYILILQISYYRMGTLPNTMKGYPNSFMFTHKSKTSYTRALGNLLIFQFNGWNWCWNMSLKSRIKSLQLLRTFDDIIYVMYLACDKFPLFWHICNLASFSKNRNSLEKCLISSPSNVNRHFDISLNQVMRISW